MLHLIMNNHWRATYNNSGSGLLRIALLLLLRVTWLLRRVSRHLLRETRLLLGVALGIGWWLYWVALLLLLGKSRSI